MQVLFMDTGWFFHLGTVLSVCDRVHELHTDALVDGATVEILEPQGKSKSSNLPPDLSATPRSHRSSKCCDNAEYHEISFHGS